MAINKSKRQHSTPGVYFNETVVDYASKSLGITTLGAVGETLKGPAFQPINISDWSEFRTYFGGTSTKKFKGSQYPKYELPYIAKSYLEQSKQLEVVRVLGLSGVNAGPAWVMTGSKYKKGEDGKAELDTTAKYNNTVFMVLRSRGEHKKASFVSPADPDNNICNDVYSYDGIEYYAQKVELIPSTSLNLSIECNPGFSKATGNFDVNMMNYGMFTIQVTDKNGEVWKYSVSLNPGDTNYIYNVLGSDPYDGDSLVYVEEIYDVALQQLVSSDEINTLNKDLVYFPEVYVVPNHKDVNDIMVNDETVLKKINLGERYLFVDDVEIEEDGKKKLYKGESHGIKVHYSFDNGQHWEQGNGINGWIYKVVEYTDLTNGKRSFYYGAYAKKVYEYKEIDRFTAETPVEEQQRKTEEYIQDGYVRVGASLIEATENSEEKIIVEGNETVFYKKSSHIEEVTNSENLKFNSDVLHVQNLDDQDYKIDSIFKEAVRVLTDDTCYIMREEGDNKTEIIRPVTLDFNNYREQYRYASTPWILSEIKGDGINAELHKLFRFHTISDGNSANTEVKISIENIMPEEGTFDVLVRDFADSDSLPRVIERYNKCDLVPGSPNYISLKIGSFDGAYHPVSKYITVEVNEDTTTKLSVPAGYMGYPVRDYNGIAAGGSQKIRYEFSENPLTVETKASKPDTKLECDIVFVEDENHYKVWVEDATKPNGGSYEMITVVTSENNFLPFPTSDQPEYLKLSEGDIYHLNKISENIVLNEPYFRYNTTIDTDIKPKKQYFGISNLVGIDADMFTYKGVEAYNEMPSGLSDCFHLDSRIDGSVDGQEVTIDGISGYTWSTVSRALTLEENNVAPQIGTEIEMEDTIYADKRYRKFTVAFCGGFDGWDYYRTTRSNSDDFKYTQYKGSINNETGYGSMFNTNIDMEALGFDNITHVMSSDYYAYLGGVRQFSNPNSLKINLLVTPGIDYVYNTLLVQDIIDMVEDERSDMLYVVTTPDKPKGASDDKNEMFTAEEAVANLDASDVDTSYACTYFPWGKYYDADNSQYIYLPITRDVVRSIAYTENVAHPWFPAAGWDRGNISAIEPRKKLKVAETDTLYDGRINFINSFANEGDKIWGDKNLQVEDNLMNRISKRRLVLRLKQLCSNACIGLIFDPNDASCSKTLKNTLTSIMDDVKSQRGIFDYRVSVDNSVENLDKLTLTGYVQIKPTPMLEYIDIQFAMTPLGVSFT